MSGQTNFRLSRWTPSGHALQGEPVLLSDPSTHGPAPVRTRPVPDQHHLLAFVEGLELLQYRDQIVGVVTARTQVEARSGTTVRVGGVVPDVAAIEARFQFNRWPTVGCVRAGRGYDARGGSEMPDSSKKTVHARPFNAPL